MHCGYQQHRQLAPLPGHLLRTVGQTVAALEQVGQALAWRGALGHAAKAAHVEPGTERSTGAVKHDRSKLSLARQLLASLPQTLEHRAVKDVHLVRTTQADLGDTVRTQAHQHTVGPAGL